MNQQTGRELSRILNPVEKAPRVRASGGPYLSGEWGIADCMSPPVATRFGTCGVDLGAHPRCTAYVDRLHALEAFQEWRAAALKEELFPLYELTCG